MFRDEGGREGGREGREEEEQEEQEENMYYVYRTERAAKMKGKR